MRLSYFRCMYQSTTMKNLPADNVSRRGTITPCNAGM
jgi:hypothetical protein